MSLIRLIADLPSVVKIALAGLAVFLSYLGVVEPVVEKASALSGRAAAAAEVAEALSSKSDQNQQVLTRVTTGERRFGVVDPPADYETRVDEFNTRVNEILRGSGAEGLTIGSRTVRAAKGTLDRFAGSGERVERAIKDIRFTAAPEQFTSVLSALEQLPVVSSVTRVSAQRESDGSRRLRVDLTVESWVLVTGLGSGGRGS